MPPEQKTAFAIRDTALKAGVNDSDEHETLRMKRYFEVKPFRYNERLLYAS